MLERESLRSSSYHKSSAGNGGIHAGSRGVRM